jgi:hypothetical protein
VLLHAFDATKTNVWDEAAQVRMLRRLPESFYEARADLAARKAKLN